MYCPSCAAQNSTDQNFCRSCGMNLEQTAISLRSHSAETLEKLDREERSLERFGTFALGGFAVIGGLAICGLFYYIFMKMVLSGSQPWAGVALILGIFFAVLSLVFVGWQESLKEKRNKFEKDRRVEDPQPAPTKPLLEDHMPQPASVIERTTDLLKEERTK